MKVIEGAESSTSQRDSELASQGLKPALVVNLSGTTEVVPSPQTIFARP